MKDQSDPCGPNNIESIGDAPYAADRARLAGLVMGRRRLFARETQLQRERTILSVNLGQDDPLVAALDQRLALSEARKRSVGAEVQKAQQEAPSIDEGVFTLFGRVTKEGNGQPGLEVAATNADGATIATGCTDDIGAYQINLDTQGTVSLTVYTLDGEKLLTDDRQYEALPGVTHQRILDLDPDARPDPCDKGSSDVSIVVPDVVDRREKEAVKILRSVGLQIGQITKEPDPKRSGRVIAQDPTAKSEVDRGTPVNMTIGDDVQVEVPEVVGMAEDQAVRVLAAVELKVGSRSTKVDPQNAGRVIDQDPGKGSKVDRGTPVALTIATADEVEVPRLIGRPLSGAKTTLTKAGLELGEVDRVATKKGWVDVVMRQKPENDVVVERGSSVSVTVGAEDTLEDIEVDKPTGDPRPSGPTCRLRRAFQQRRDRTRRAVKADRHTRHHLG